MYEYIPSKKPFTCVISLTLIVRRDRLVLVNELSHRTISFSYGDESAMKVNKEVVFYWIQRACIWLDTMWVYLPTSSQHHLTTRPLILLLANTTHYVMKLFNTAISLIDHMFITA